MTLNRSRLANDALDHVIEGVENEFKNVLDGEAMIKKISERFRDTFNCPPVSEFEFLFHKNFSDDEVIVALFQPQDEQMSYFPLILEAASAPSPVPLANLRSLILSLIFLIHRKQWSFMEQFILHGGLFVMAEMIGDSNLYVRGQALEIVLSIIDCETYDWFKPVQPGDLVQSSLHKQLLSLVNQSPFLKNLVANRVGSYPGGSCRALQILAFWLSWLRAVHTQDQKLHLSALVLSELKLWSVLPGTTEDTAAEEEAKLAGTIYEDFGFLQYGRSVTEEAGAGSSSSTDSNFALEGLSNLPVGGRQSRVIEESAAAASSVVEEVPVIVSPEQRCAELKAAGNALFKDNQLKEAIEQYKLALTELNTTSSSNSSLVSLQVDLFTNCATCWWKLYQQLPSEATAASKSELLSNCDFECRTALFLAPHYPKAVYRLVTVLLEENKPEEALPLLLQALQHHRESRLGGNATAASSAASSESIEDPSSGNSSSSVDSNIDLLTNLRVRCIAALLMKNSNEVGALTHSDLGMSVKGAQLLQSILQRNQNDAAVDWQIVRPSAAAAAAAGTAEEEDKAEAAQRDAGTSDATDTKPAAVDEVDLLLGRRTADTSKWILEDLLNKNRLAAENHNSIVAAANSANKENKKFTTTSGASSSSSSATSKTDSKSGADKKSTGTKQKKSSADTGSKTQTAFNDFKKLTKQYDQKFGSDVIIADSKRMELKLILDNAGKCVDSIWSEGSKLNDVLSCILEESHVMLLLRLSHQHAESGDVEWAAKLVSQLVRCDRIDVVMSLMLAGNEPLKQYLRDLGPSLSSVAAASPFTEKYCR